MSEVSEAFRRYVTSSGVDFDALTVEQKREWRRDFEQVCQKPTAGGPAGSPAVGAADAPAGDSEIRQLVKYVKKQSKAADTAVKLTKALARTVIASAKKQAASTASERARHQDQFKNEAISHYQAQSTTSSNYIRCSVLGHFIRRDHVVSGHLCGLDEQHKLPVLGKDTSFKWSWKNCVLMYKPIEKLFDSMEVTLLYHPDTHQVTFQVLFDSLLDKDIGYDFALFEGYSKWGEKQKKRFRKSLFRKYADLNGQPLHFPVLTLPSKTILNWAAKSAYDAALNSEAPHQCAVDSMPSEGVWEAMTGANTPSASRLESFVEGDDLASDSEEGGENEEGLAIEDLV